MVRDFEVFFFFCVFFCGDFFHGVNFKALVNHFNVNYFEFRCLHGNFQL